MENLLGLLLSFFVEVSPNKNYVGWVHSAYTADQFDFAYYDNALNKTKSFRVKVQSFSSLSPDSEKGKNELLAILKEGEKGTVVVRNCQLKTDKHYYECIVETSEMGGHTREDITERMLKTGLVTRVSKSEESLN